MKNRPCATALCLYLAGAAIGLPGTAIARVTSPTAVFPFGFDDTSLQGQMQGSREDERQRLNALDTELRDMLAKSGCCEMLDMANVDKQTQNLDMRTCNGCDVDLAQRIGAKISVTGWVQKVSNLILNINLVARNVTTGRVIEAGSVDVRGNTDESWSRGLSYLLRNRLHPSDWR